MNTNGMIGANPEQLRILATEFERAANDIDASVVTANSNADFLISTVVFSLDGITRGRPPMTRRQVGAPTFRLYCSFRAQG